VSETLVKELIESGVHFGHRASRWNPKMAPYIYARKNLIHIIDVRETIRGLFAGQEVLDAGRRRGSLILLVGTKRQAQRDAVERESLRCGMPFVSERWLGGCLTNFRTVRSRLGRLEELEALRSGEELGHLLEEDAVGAQSRVSQDVSQPERHPDHEPLAGVRGGL